LPDTLLPPAKLLDYLGPTALRTALSLVPGEVSEPVRSGQGVHVLWLVEREEAAARPLAEVRSEVASELTRRRDEEALRGYLDRLRAAARIRVSDDSL
jgi:parvulin-like peptidyl-prolyl isomerase